MNCPHCGGFVEDESPENSPGFGPRTNQERDEVSLLSLLPSGSSPDCISKSVELLRKTGKKVRGTAYEYPAEFEAGWLKTAMNGSKFDAFLAWKRAGRPTAKTIATSWAKWSELTSWRRGYVPHVRKWIRGRCFEQEPREDERQLNARPGANGAASWASQKAAANSAALVASRNAVKGP